MKRRVDGLRLDLAAKNILLEFFAPPIFNLCVQFGFVSLIQLLRPSSL